MTPEALAHYLPVLVLWVVSFYVGAAIDRALVRRGW